MKGFGLCLSLKVYMGVRSSKEAINRSLKVSSLTLIDSFAFVMSHDVLDTSENISGSYRLKDRVVTETGACFGTFKLRTA